MPQKGKKTQEPFSEKSKGWFYFNISLRVLHSLLLVGLAVLIIGGALAAGIGAGYFAYLVEDTNTPTKKELQKSLGDISETSKLTYADSKEIATIRSDLMRTTIKSDQISELIKKAIISTEDEYFYEHNGVVPKAVVRALLSEAIGFGGGGGSTLTQQIVKQQVLSSETTFKRKANEILLAMEVEKFFSKDEIVTLYLNVSPFGRNNKGQNIAGVQEAAKGIFGKNAKDVNLAQAAFIAGLPQSPIIYSPYDNTGEIKENLTAGLERKDFVLFSMYRNHAITKKEYEEAKNYDLKKDFLKRQNATTNDHGFLYYTVLGEAQEIVAKQLATNDKLSTEEFNKDETHQKYLELAKNELVTGGYTVKSTIDKAIFDAMQQGVADYGYLLDNYNGDRVEVGNVMMDNQTGRILGFVGSRDFSKNQNNHAFDTMRAAGSSIKPVLVYGPAIDQGLIGTETRVSDYPTSWKAGENAGEDIVNATNKGSKTFQTVREALNESTNIPAYHVYQDLQQNTSANFAYENYLKKMNYTALDEWSFESAPLGPMDVTTLQQTNGFQALANGGVYQEGYLIESITDNQGNAIYKHKENPVQVYSPATASIMNDLMRSVLDAQITTPFKSSINNLNWYLAQADWIGKTGSSDYYKDSWLIVSTPSVTISSWSGFDDNTTKNDQDAGQRTGQYLANLVNRIYMASPDVFATEQTFTLDKSVKKATVSKFTGALPGTVTVNNRSVQTPKDTTTSYWATDNVPQSSFKFGIGGTDANYLDYWNKAIKTTTKTTSSTNRATSQNTTNQANEKKEEEKETDKNE
ncbi:transglycosylase domain-containing protein [Enterococcus songbeiensis]|uniref:transglycosylase domain-containing protein n=1 Tax=Enterococcus songbeiensis TaxID=2559927 RepID=UPI0010F9467F|nr:transglycosylase domain-containing protein [Enterococcus songbeiensis]